MSGLVGEGSLQGQLAERLAVGQRSDGDDLRAIAVDRTSGDGERAVHVLEGVVRGNAAAGRDGVVAWIGGSGGRAGEDGLVFEDARVLAKHEARDFIAE